jgi:hypothetical protein
MSTELIAVMAALLLGTAASIMALALWDAL